MLAEAELNKRVVKRALENFNRGNLSAYLTLYDAKCVVYGIGVTSGINNIRQFYHDLLLAFPDGNFTIEDMIAEDDKITCRYTFRGTHWGIFMGILPTNKKITTEGLTIFRLDEGRCIEKWTQVNFWGMMQQIGVFPSHLRTEGLYTFSPPAITQSTT